MKSLDCSSSLRNRGVFHKPSMQPAESASDISAALKKLTTLVAQGERPYEDVAEQIEDLAYALCENGSLEKACTELTRVSMFFETMTEKSDEQCRDLADVYMVTGQIHQFAGCFLESIQWFSRAAVVDDRYAAPYHSMAVSYAQLHEFLAAIKCYEQELALAPGNYYTYLLVADLYEREKQAEEVERCLKCLLDRDPENIQGLHTLIRHYETANRDVETALLVRRLIHINKQYSRIEVVIRSYYLCRHERYAEVIDFLDTWNRNGDAVTITDLVKAHALSAMRQYKRRQQVLASFKQRNHGRDDVMMGKLQEFRTLFGDAAAENLRKQLFFTPPKPDKSAAA